MCPEDLLHDQFALGSLMCLSMPLLSLIVMAPSSMASLITYNVHTNSMIIGKIFEKSQHMRKVFTEILRHFADATTVGELHQILKGDLTGECYS